MMMPGATWVGPTVNRTPRAMGTIIGLVLHIQDGNEQGTEAWQRNPASQVSSHFLLPKAGGVRQMVDTADRAWCQVSGNRQWVSVECEGHSGDQLTPGQLAGAAQILSWLHLTYGVYLRLANDPTATTVQQGGLAYHALGGKAWGDHLACPGAPIIAQRPAIITAAQLLAGGDMQLTDTITVDGETKTVGELLSDGWRFAWKGEGPYAYQINSKLSAGQPVTLTGPITLSDASVQALAAALAAHIKVS